MDIPGLQALLFVERHGAVVAAPDVQCDAAAAQFFGVGAGARIQGLAHMLAPAGFVHAQVVDIQGLILLFNKTAY